MDKKLGLILGSLFILMSGLIFTIERLTANVYWLAQINTGTWDNTPQTIPLINNLFTVVFLLIGIIFFVLSFQEKRK